MSIQTPFILGIISFARGGHEVANYPAETEKQVTYDFVVNVISGSLQGRKFSGFFSYDPSALKGEGQETIMAQETEFNYLSKYTHQDGVPSLSFNDGKFERLIWVLGKPTERFGFNAGFQRGQFGRYEEAFIREGKDYFGYLDKNTYVDGAGTITYNTRKSPKKSRGLWLEELKQAIASQGKECSAEQVLLWAYLCEDLNSHPEKAVYSSDLGYQSHPAWGLFGHSDLAKSRREFLWKKYQIQLIIYQSSGGWRLSKGWEAKLDFLQKIYLDGEDWHKLPMPWIEGKPRPDDAVLGGDTGDRTQPGPYDAVLGGQKKKQDGNEIKISINGNPIEIWEGELDNSWDSTEW